MEREQVIDRILYILKYIGKENLIETFKKLSETLSLEDLEKIRIFLDTGQSKVLLSALQEKKKEYMHEVEKIKHVKTKIKLGTIKKQEQLEESPEEILDELLKI